MLLGPDPNEGHLLLGVDGLDCQGHVCCELRNKGAVLNSVGIWHRGLDGDALGVYDHAAFDAFVRVDSVQGVLYFLGHCYLVICVCGLFAGLLVWVARMAPF